MPAPSEILIQFAQSEPPIACRSVAEMDAVLDRLHAEYLEKVAAEEANPLNVGISIPGYWLSFGVGSDDTFLSVCVDPYDDGVDEMWMAVDDTKPEDGVAKMFYGVYQDTYWYPQDLIPTSAVRCAVRHFVEHQERSPELKWRC